MEILLPRNVVTLLINTTHSFDCGTGKKVKYYDLKNNVKFQSKIK